MISEGVNLIRQLQGFSFNVYDTPQKLDKAIKWMLACRNSKEERLDEEKQEDT